MKKSAAVWNRTRDLLYYAPHVYSPSKSQACAKLVGCLTYHKRITIDTYVNNKPPHGMPSVMAFYYELR